MINDDDGLSTGILRLEYCETGVLKCSCIGVQEIFPIRKGCLLVDYGRILHSQCVLKPPLNYFKQKRPTNLIGNVLNVNLKLHNSEIGLDILQKCKILFKFRKPGPLARIVY